MKNLVWLFPFIIFSCKREPVITVTVVDELSERKTYADLHELNLTDAQYDSVYAANPEMHNSRLEKAGLIKDGRLLVEKISYNRDSFKLKNINGEVVKAKLDSDDDNPYKSVLILTTQSNDSIYYNFESPFTDYCLADVVPGGYPEIITLNEWYIANGDNFDVTVYEVKARD